MTFLRRALYASVGKRAQTAARREWRKTDAYKLVDQATRAYSRGSRLPHLPRALSHLSRFGNSQQLMSLLESSDAGVLIGEVARYAKSGGTNAFLIDQLLKSLGPAGVLIRNLSKAVNSGATKAESSVDRELAAARALLQSFGYEVLPPPGRETAEDLNRGIAAARDYLETRGYEVRPTDQPGQQPSVDAPSDADQAPRPQDQQQAERRGTVTGSRGRGRDTFPQGVSKSRADGRPRKVVDLDIAGDGGSKRRFPVNHPIVTGRLVRSPESSNVYGFFYDLDRTTLFVRYLQASRKDPNSKVMGPLYAYSNVPPEVFLKLHDAPSKGTFIWDNIRIRGTVSGHRYDYRLVAVRGGNVPRKATFIGNGEEAYIRRTIRTQNMRTGEIKTQRSRLPDQVVRGFPNRGTPSQGFPNRGAPRRG